jgi:hypothetical protein
MQQSHAHNPRKGITGILCHSDKVYMQVLEGGRDAINALYAKIVRDPRHTDVVLLHYEEINERRYACWTMGQANLAKHQCLDLLRFSEAARDQSARHVGQARAGADRRTAGHRDRDRPRLSNTGPGGDKAL